MLVVGGIIERQIILILITLVGYFLAKTGHIEHNVRHFLSFLCINVLIPCSLFYTLATTVPSKTQLYDFFFVVVFVFIIEGLCYFAAKVLFRKFGPKQQTILRYSLTSPNVAFIGLPIIESFYGAEGVLYLTAFMIPLNFFMFLFSFRLFLPPEKKRVSVVKQLMHPTLIAVFLGFVFMMLGLQPPTMVLEAVELLAHSATPIALLPIGAILASIDLRSTLFRVGFWFSALRLVIIPLFAMGILLLLNTPVVVAGVITLSLGMPIAVSTPALATSYKGDVVFSSRLLLLSTVLSMVTLPLLASLVTALF